MRSRVDGAGDGAHDEVAVGEQRDHHDARLDERPAALGDELEDAVEVGLGAERAGDRHRRLERGDGPLELVAAVALAAVEVGVVDRDRGPVGEHEQRLLVGRR